MVTPLGMLQMQKADGCSKAELVRGISSYPSVGESVLVPTPEQARAIAQGDDNAHVPIGTSPVAGDAQVRIDPDKLFGRHLAVLGNTGSGKSCTVAGLIRWCIEAAAEDAAGVGEVEGEEIAPNARFVVLDPNGEYSRAFQGLPNTRVLNLAVEPEVDSTEHLRVPAWMWNSDEWAGVLSAKPGIQRPVLNEALRTLRGGASATSTDTRKADQVIRGYCARLRAMTNSGLEGYQGWRGRSDFGGTLTNCLSDLEYVGISHLGDCGEDLVATLTKTIEAQSWVSANGKSSGFNDFSTAQADAVIAAFDSVLTEVPEPGVSEPGVNIDAPLQFDSDALADYIDFLASDSRYSANAQHIAPMNVRLRTILNDERISSVIASDTEPTFVDLLTQYLGNDDPGSCVTVVDLSLVPSDVLHTCVSVVGRIVFEALQRYRKHHLTELPTVMVLEEAHTFISGHSLDSDSQASRHMCRGVFERIAREGRKFGLSLVLSSQRPSELSATVLAQCNSFLLHRLVNDADQALVKRLVPDALGDLLGELPSLPSRQAILLGWASLIPTLVQMNEVPEQHRPHSNDPAFWDVWRGAARRPKDWDTIVEGWTK
ncbi:DUF87 domain-containing protein [Rhodococcus hoagii]|nr:DUF87 domain-containing protein [Prescottella equi]